MNFVNETPFSAELLNTVIDTERMTASVIARVTYEVEEALPGAPARRLAVAAEQPWKVSRMPWDSPQGPMEQDVAFMKGGVDLFVFGSARAPKGEPVSEMDVTVEIDPPEPAEPETKASPEAKARAPFLRRATVSGARVWVRRPDQTFAPTAPAPFVAIPLTPASAFGGKSAWDGLPVPWMENPDGVGFVMLEAEAEGARLPHLEEPDARMTAWSDRPPLCGFGFCPMVSPARVKNGLVLTDDFEIKDWRPQLFNTAYPKMIAPEARPDDILRVTGVLHEGPLSIVLPKVPVSVRLQFGERIEERVPSVDQIGVEVDEKRVFVTYRFPFRYVVRHRELREAILVPRKG